jgi:hypothetical protein
VIIPVITIGVEPLYACRLPTSTIRQRMAPWRRQGAIACPVVAMCIFEVMAYIGAKQRDRQAPFREGPRDPARAEIGSGDRGEVSPLALKAWTTLKG